MNGVEHNGMDSPRKVFVEFKDENGNIKRGLLKLNNGRCVTVLVGAERILMSRKEITFVRK
jgi:hypothetical protein